MKLKKIIGENISWKIWKYNIALISKTQVTYLCLLSANLKPNILLILKHSLLQSLVHQQLDFRDFKNYFFKTLKLLAKKTLF